MSSIFACKYICILTCLPACCYNMLTCIFIQSFLQYSICIFAYVAVCMLKYLHGSMHDPLMRITPQDWIPQQEKWTSGRGARLYVSQTLSSGQHRGVTLKRSISRRNRSRIRNCLQVLFGGFGGFFLGKPEAKYLETVLLSLRAWQHDTCSVQPCGRVDFPANQREAYNCCRAGVASCGLLLVGRPRAGKIEDN